MVALQDYKKHTIWKGTERQIGIAYRLTGEEQGKLVVCLHGLCMNSTIFQNFAEYFALRRKLFRVLAFDLPGHGFTDPMPNGDYCLDTGVRLLAEGLAESVNHTVLGYSMGGLYAIRYAAQYPDRVNSLILASISHKTMYKLTLGCVTAEEALARIKHSYEKLADCNEKVVPDFSEFAGRRDGQVLSAAFSGMDLSAAEKLIKENWPDEFDSDLEKISKANIPVLWLHGECDNLLSEEDTREASRKALSSAPLEFSSKELSRCREVLIISF